MSRSILTNTVRKAQEEGKPGLPICIAASKVDGLVLALSAFHHSMNYRSAVLFGHVTIVNSLEEKEYAMTIITDKVVKQRWANTRLPATKAEISSTSILKVKIESASGKARAEPLGDDKEDLENGDLS
jgi:nitroimidazol reductase NimA-like FMN-containing flavoprotein (pyridoxamine 5'-phosphate oxidase superfamily)